MFAFTKHEKYRRQEIWEMVKGKDQRMSRNFQQSGYERIDEIFLPSSTSALREMPAKYSLTSMTAIAKS